MPESAADQLNLTVQVQSCAVRLSEDLSLLGGASVLSYTMFKLSITLVQMDEIDTKKGGPLDRPR
jgi:hypothetical protein